jgi:rubrerythrin
VEEDSVSGSDEKDRFGDKLREVERAREDQFFKKRDEELISKLREKKEEESVAEARVAAQDRCPKCGTQLQRREYLEVEVDECPSCGGIWLDQGELEEIARRESQGWLGRLLRGRAR